MKRILFFALFLITNQAISQDSEIIYFKKNGTIVVDKDSADYLQIINDPEPGSKLYPVLEMYMNGNNKTTGFSKSSYSPIYEGHVLTFFPNGKRESFSTYSNGKLIDISTKYYPNGKFYMTTDYKSKPEKYIAAKDSLGNDILMNGQGEIKIYNSDFSRVEEEGKVLNGLREGLWKGQTDSTTYVEQYSKSKVISGVSTDKEGKEYKYDTYSSAKNFEKNYAAVHKFLIKQLESSINKNDKNALPKEPIPIKCIINKEGYITDSKLGAVLSPKVRKIILDSLQQAPSFDPGRIRGMPAKIHLTFFLETHEIKL